ncbi:MAG: XRE family transcriptional regulator [Rubrobacteraceae bacterium]
MTEVQDRAKLAIQEAHREAVMAPIADLVDFLIDLLSPRLVAYIAGVKDTKTVRRWASGETGEMRQQDREERIRLTYEIARLLIQVDSPRIVKAWFIGLNPQLDDTSPAEAIHEGKLKEALYAARAFTAGG